MVIKDPEVIRVHPTVEGLKTMDVGSFRVVMVREN